MGMDHMSAEGRTAPFRSIRTPLSNIGAPSAKEGRLLKETVHLPNM